jgi:hypothetical protein
MSEFEPRNNTEPLDEEFQEKLLSEQSPTEMDNLIETKAKEILAELKEEAKKESELENHKQESPITSEPDTNDSDDVNISEQSPPNHDLTKSIHLLYGLVANEADEKEIQTLSNLIAICQSKIDHTSQEIHSNQSLISLYRNQSGTARDKIQVKEMAKKVEGLEIEKETFETLMELSLYNSEVKLDLDGIPIDKLISRYRIYQTFIYKYNIPSTNPIITHLKYIEEQYHNQILHLIESEHIDKRYGLGSATGKPLSMKELEKFLVPNTEAEGFWEYQRIQDEIKAGRMRFLTQTQRDMATDNAKGQESESFVISELIQTPGVLMTINIPKFSVGDTQYKADTIVITLDPEFDLSVSDDYIQRALYQLILEFGILTKKHNDTYQKISGINPESPIIDDIIHTNPSIKFSGTNNPKDEKLPIYNLLRMHRVQIKTRSDAMASTLEDYQKSPYTKEPNDIGLLAKEYRLGGDSIPKPFNKTDFQIAAQTILGIPIH